MSASSQPSTPLCPLSHRHPSLSAESGGQATAGEREGGGGGGREGGDCGGGGGGEGGGLDV